MTASPGRKGLAPAPRNRLADYAHIALRESIVSGRFHMGERLIETQLADELQMSRAPIREALRRLSEEGLVDDSPHRGMHVREFGPDDFIDLYNTRLALEPAALRLFIRREGDTAPLHAGITAMRKAASKDDARLVAEAELGFHAAMVEGSGNRSIVALFSSLRGQLLVSLAIDDAAYPDLSLVPEEHVPLLELIEARREAKAVAELEQHIVGSIADLLDRTGGDPAGLLVRPRDR